MTAGRVGAATIAFALVLLIAAPAGAHTTSGPPASNYRTVLDGVRPSASGVTVSLAPDRESLELRVTGPAHVTILGYRDEPYLRVDARGVFENLASPAVAINRSRNLPSRPSNDGARGQRWVQISDQPIARWHDHRVHWMGGATPSAVRRDPDRTHVITTWEIPIRVDGARATINGSIRWDPPPASWPWWAFAAAVSGGVVLAVRTRTARHVVVGVVMAMAGVEALHFWAAWPFSLGTTVGRIGEGLPSAGAVLVCLIALVWVARRGVWSGAPALVLAGLFVFVSGGLADFPTLSHAHAPSRLAPEVARFLVALALGLGLGTALVGATRLRAPRPST